MNAIPEPYPGAHTRLIERAILVSGRAAAEARGDDEAYRVCTEKIREVDETRWRLEREAGVVWRRPCGCVRYAEESVSGGGEGAVTEYCHFGGHLDAVMNEHFARYLSRKPGRANSRAYRMYLKRENELDAHLGGLLFLWRKAGI